MFSKKVCTYLVRVHNDALPLVLLLLYSWIVDSVSKGARSLFLVRTRLYTLKAEPALGCISCISLWCIADGGAIRRRLAGVSTVHRWWALLRKGSNAVTKLLAPRRTHGRMMRPLVVPRESFLSADTILFLVPLLNQNPGSRERSCRSGGGTPKCAWRKSRRDERDGTRTVLLAEIRQVREGRVSAA